MGHGAFTEDTRVEPAGEGRYRGLLSGRWGVLGGTPNGGYLMAVAGRAMRAALPHPDPVTTTAHFLAPPTTGEVDIEVDVLRAGRRHSTAEARLRQGGRECVRLLATFADLAAVDGPTRLLRRPPQLPPVEECVDVTSEALTAEAGQGTPAPPILVRFDHRMPKGTMDWSLGRPTGDGAMAGWCRFADGEEMDTLGLLVVADAYPPAVFNSGVDLGWVPTIELTVQIRARPAPGYLNCRFSTEAVTGGYLEEDGEIWDGNGSLIALSRQLALVPRPRR